MGAVGAMVLAAMHKRLTWPLVRQGMGVDHAHHRHGGLHPDRLDGVQLVFQGVGGGIWIEHMLLTGLPGGQVGFLIAVNIFVFFLAFFLDFFEIAFIIMPLLAPGARTSWAST
jgi:TRAP-type mannitol/chloroaromatic compound transport system permease large subunit